MRKKKNITKEEKEKYKAFFEFARDIIERCKLPTAIKFRKKLGYNHDNIMVPEETSIAEKIIKLFPDENIVLNKKIFGLKIYILLSKLMKEITKITTQTMKKKEKTCFKDIILKPLRTIQMILSLILINF